MHGTSRKLLTFAHIALAVSILGADLVLITLGLAGLAGDPITVYPAAELIGSRVMWPLAIASVATGVTLALTGPYGLFRFWWVAIKLTITLLLTGLLAFVLLPALAAAAEATASGAAPSESRRLLLVLGPIASSSLLLTNIALAVFKPKWRFMRAARPERTEVPA
jgi:hypothetical protein